VATGLHQTADTARELAQTLERGADALDTASRTADDVTRKIDRMATSAIEIRDQLMTQVRAHPLAATAAAFAAGFVVAQLGD
jgi:methyl-accepting chemotaxis protein